MFDDIWIDVAVDEGVGGIVLTNAQSSVERRDLLPNVCRIIDIETEKRKSVWANLDGVSDVPSNTACIDTVGVHDDLMIDRFQHRLTVYRYIFEIVEEVSVGKIVQYRWVWKRGAVVVNKPSGHVEVISWWREFSLVQE